MPKVPAFDPIRYLVRRRFPFVGMPSSAMKSSKRSSLSRDDLEKSAKEARELLSELSRKSASEIDALVKEEKLKEAKEIEQRAEAIEQSRFFNQPSAIADFEHYCKCAYWTLDEAVALSFGKQPTVVNWATIAPLKNVSAFAKAYESRRDIALRAVWARQLFDPVYPSIFLSWARQTEIVVASELNERAVASGISLEGWRDLYEAQVAKHEAHVAELRGHFEKQLADLHSELSECRELAQTMQRAKQKEPIAADAEGPERALGTRERENLQIMAFLGASRGYEYDPELRTPAARKMMKDFEDLGLSYTDDRIRYHWRKGLELVPGDWRTRLGLKPNSDKN